ncbi:MAG TPA: hypothetical protein VIS56_01970 [Candidatus Saccharimonadales bacterium]
MGLLISVTIVALLSSKSRTHRQSDRDSAPRKTGLDKDGLPSLALSLVRIYLPKKFTRVHVVALIYGSFIGGFLGGVAAAGYEPVTPWLVLLAVLLGAGFGAIFALSLVPKK